MATGQPETWAERATRVLAQHRRQAGAARRAVVELLNSQACALSAVEIEAALRESGRPVGRASIYRILEELERLELVHRVPLGQTMSRFEPVRSGEGHHHHLVCDNCGTVVPFADEELEHAVARLSRRVPMRVAEHEIVLHGACEDCSP